MATVSATITRKPATSNAKPSCPAALRLRCGRYSPSTVRQDVYVVICIAGVYHVTIMRTLDLGVRLRCGRTGPFIVMAENMVGSIKIYDVSVRSCRFIVNAKIIDMSLMVSEVSVRLRHGRSAVVQDLHR
ncbi:hypothetical protein Aduo_000536 [Ancylostoma duodenale]